ncbi:MAG: N-acetyltransferase family protein [Clostridia bacterium]|nr:N-acetyltransferase family protein [Clostridia bacterium]
MDIRPVRPSDAEALAEIYNYYIQSTLFSLEEQPLSPDAFAGRIKSIQAAYPYLVAEENGTPLGYAYLAPFSPRSAYRKTADVSLYVAASARGKGIGKALYLALEEAGRNRGLENLVAIITSANETSLAFHLKMGFTTVGRLPGVGYKFGTYADVLYCQKRLLPPTNLTGEKGNPLWQPL